MSQKQVLDAIKDMGEIAKDLGLDYFPVIFEFVNRDIMLEGCSYGLPTRARHYSYGRAYQQQKLFTTMGMSKVYEIIFNNNPAYAFLLNTNADVINKMVGAHCFGHSAFFKTNVMFQPTDRDMVYKAADRARRIDAYIEQYGLEKVEQLMDYGFALERHIDWNKGEHRREYPAPTTKWSKKQQTEFDDVLGLGKPAERSMKKEVIGASFPPRPEKDLLWFIINYGRLAEWEKDVLSIMRSEAYYFYPIVKTKIINEGLASFYHAELMYRYDKLSEEEYLDFSKVHSGVINPGNMFRINPYYIGFKVLTDIRERWDEKYKNGESKLNGIQMVNQVAAEEDDASFLRNYLTPELAQRLKLFNYGYRYKRKPKQKLGTKHGIIEIKDRDLNKIIDNIIRPTFNYGVPMISIDKVDGSILKLKHDTDFGPLDEIYTKKTLEFIYKLWGAPVKLYTYNYDGNSIVYSYSKIGIAKKEGVK